MSINHELKPDSKYFKIGGTFLPITPMYVNPAGYSCIFLNKLQTGTIFSPRTEGLT